MCPQGCLFVRAALPWRVMVVASGVVDQVVVQGSTEGDTTQRDRPHRSASTSRLPYPGGVIYPDRYLVVLEHRAPGLVIESQILRICQDSSIPGSVGSPAQSLPLRMVASAAATARWRGPNTVAPVLPEHSVGTRSR